MNVSSKDDDFEKRREERRKEIEARRRELDELKRQLEIDRVRSREKYARESDKIYKRMAELSESYVETKNRRAQRQQERQDNNQENKPD